MLFPGMSLPLQIFEQRYKTMTRELLGSGGVFGVVLIKEGSETGEGAIPHPFGTTATIEAWREVEGGRFLLSTRGVQRFRLIRLLPPDPYPRGEIEHVIDDEDRGKTRPVQAVETVRATFPAYFRLALSLTDQWARGLDLPQGAHALVNQVAPLLKADEEVKQRLLEIEPAAERVALLAEVLDELLERTQEEVVDYRRRKFEGFGARN
ncbi:MAG: hypothetical protein DYG91_01105 [Chloroflexi bacterium CFX7]|nr:hypothetical protein [Chloroflexi bacterium CFX7]